MTTQLLPRLAALAIVALSPLAVSVPAFAASDAQMLQSYAGSYTGSGTIAGTPPQPVRCRLSLQSAGPAKLNYIGRCTGAGASFGLTGLISIDGSGRFIAAMSSEGGMTSTAIGTKRGNGVVFNSKTHQTMQGRDLNISSTLSLTGGTIRIDFSAKDNRTGKTTAGSIPFTKS